jgi:hypothetical protein
MAYNHEELTLWSLASLTKYFKSRDFGVPVKIANQALEKDDPKPNELQIIFDGPDFVRIGTKNERYGVIHVRVFVNTTYVPTDIYHHIRLKAKVAEAMMQEVPLQRLGAATYDKAVVGFLRPVPTESVTITTISVEEPDASLVAGTFCIELC